VRHLVKIKADINIANSAGVSPLWAAAYNGNLSCVQFLVRKRADLNAKHEDGRDALYVATRNGDLECVQCLVVQSGKRLFKRTPDHRKIPLEVATGSCKSYLEAILKIQRDVSSDLKMGFLRESQNEAEFVKKILQHLVHKEKYSAKDLESLQKYDVHSYFTEFFKQNAEKLMSTDENSVAAVARAFPNCMQSSI